MLSGMLVSDMIVESRPELCHSLFWTPVLGEQKPVAAQRTLIRERLALAPFGQRELGLFAHQRTRSKPLYTGYGFPTVRYPKRLRPDNGDISPVVIQGRGHLRKVHLRLGNLVHVVANMFKATFATSSRISVSL